ncbi:MAG: glycosyltransferase family 39 protein [Minisyncoccia bacterium]
MFTPPVERALAVCIAIALGAAAFIMLYGLVGPEPLGHDESVYLTKARSWIDGSPADQWGVYRPIAMSAFGWIALQFSDAEQTMRLFGVIFGALTPVIVFLLFRRIANVFVGLAAGALVISSPLFLEQAPQFLNDIPSSTILFALMLVIYLYYESAGKSTIIYLAAPLAALAFYIRYGTTTSLIMIGLFSYLILLPRFLKKNGHDFAMLGKTILLSFALVVPHIIHALFTTHSPFGILKRAEEVAHRAYLGEGLVMYVSWLPNELAGWPIGGLAIFASIAIIVILFRRDWREYFAAPAWAGWIGLGTFLLTGLLVHAEARYVFFPMILLAGSGLAIISLAIAYWSPLLARATLVLVAIFLLVYAVPSFSTTKAFLEGKQNDRYRLAYIKASNAIRADVGTDSCTLFAIGTYSPSLSWYSRCAIHLVSSRPAFERDFAEAEGTKRYSIILTKIVEPQVTPQRADEFGVALEEMFRESSLGARGDLVVYRLQKKPEIIATTTPSATTTPGVVE